MNIDIMGDVEILSTIHEIRTAQIDVSKMTAPGQREVSLRIPSGVVIENNLEKVTVDIDIKVVPQ